MTDYSELRRKYVPKGVYLVNNVTVVKGEGAKVWDINGNEYIDFTTGIAVLNLGHRPREVVEAIKDQAEKLLHQCIHVANYPPYLELAEKLSKKYLWGDAKTLLLNSGAEAVENAVKIARYWTRAMGIIVFDYSFHGRTNLTMTMTSKHRPYKLWFGAYSPGIIRLPYPDPYRCPFKADTEEECGEYALEYLEKALKTHTDKEETAAIVLEPVAGEGGYVVPPKNFVEGVARIAKENCILFISDEIQTGMGRTGRFWGIEHFNAEPDLITVGKALASGLPLSAVVGRKEIMDSVHEGGLGGTFGGNPVAAVAALKTIDLIDKSLGRARKVGEKMERWMEEMYNKYEVIGHHRGLGPMRAFEFVKNRETKEPNPELVKKLIKKGVEKGILLLSAGIYGNVVRIVPPINIDDDTLEKGFNRFEEALRDALNSA